MSASGVYFRVKRESGYEDVAFEDLTEDEQDEVMSDKSERWLKLLAKELADIINILESGI